MDLRNFQQHLGYLGHDYYIVWLETQFEVWKETCANSNSLIGGSLDINLANQTLHSIEQTEELLGSQRQVTVSAKKHGIPNQMSRYSSKDLLPKSA